MSHTNNKYRCPKCKGLLSEVAESRSFLCAVCKSYFPIHNNVPILIDEESSVFRISKIIDQGYGNIREIKSRPNVFLKTARCFIRILTRITPTLYSKKRAIEVAEVFLKRINGVIGNKITVLSIGNGDGGIIFRELKNNPRFNLLETDVYISVDRMFVSDIQQIPLESQSVDIILVEGVLEHVIDPSRAVSEVHRVLKRDGLVLSTTPFILGVHMEVADYTRFTRLGLIKLFQGFQPIECGVIEGAFVALAYQISYAFMTLASAMTLGNSIAIKFAKYAGNFFIFWLKYIDKFSRDNPISQDSAASLYYIGKKVDDILSDSAVNSQFSGYGICPK